MYLYFEKTNLRKDFAVVKQRFIYNLYKYIFKNISKAYKNFSKVSKNVLCNKDVETLLGIICLP